MSRLLVIQHMEREGPGLFSKIAENRNMKIQIIRLYLGEDLPKVYKGDLLLFLPIVESLKNTWDCEITLAVNGEKKNLVQGNPYLNVINPEDVNSDEYDLSYLMLE